MTEEEAIKIGREISALGTLRGEIIDAVDRDAGGVLSMALLGLVGGEGSVSVCEYPSGTLGVSANGPTGSRTIMISFKIEEW